MNVKNNIKNKALLVYNDFLHSDKFNLHYKWLRAAAEKHGISLECEGNSKILCSYASSLDESLEKALLGYDFVLFWDKDIRLGKRFADTCLKADIPIYNNIQAIADCDDKSATYEKIWRWNDSHDGSEQIKMIPTVVAPMTYENIGYTSFDFLDRVISEFGFPLVVKECFGSFGMQVYMVHDRDEFEKNCQRYRRKTNAFSKIYKGKQWF